MNRALEQAAKSIIAAGGNDGRTSRADLKAKLPTLPATESKLVDIFFKFIDHRDFKTGAQVTAKDVNRAVEYAKEHMVAKYDLNNNGLSKDEIAKMSLTGKRAVDLAKALKEAGIDPKQGMLATWNSFYELTQNVSQSNRVDYTAADTAKISPELAKMMITATHQSSYTHVKTLADAFEAVDQGEIVVRTLTDKRTGEKLLAIDYGAGDNTYGALFNMSNKLVAQIHDGDISFV
ncbi:MAG: hypothetical protein JNK82_33375 [Myxococcaceae bacterium]|nr:hypothetical protein [Myxococcaceae bacterium]